jgi:hypothetical protein
MINYRFYSCRELAKTRRTIIEDSNDQDHKWWEVKLPYQRKKHKTKLLQQNE